MIFSKQILTFLKELAGPNLEGASIVPKSDSAGVPGDILFFKYSLNKKRAWRLFLLVQPIARVAGTGNLLLTGLKIPMDGSVDPVAVAEAYRNKTLPKDSYRTYIMSKIYGPLRRIPQREDLPSSPSVPPK